MDLLTSHSIGLTRILTSPGLSGRESEDHYYRSHERIGGGLAVRLIPLVAVFAILVLTFEVSP